MPLLTGGLLLEGLLKPGNSRAAGGSESAEFQQFLDRIGTLDTTHKDAFRALIDGWVADGNAWTKADCIYALRIDTSSNAAQNLKSSSFTLTASGSPTFTADVGYSGGTTKYLDTNFNPTSGSPNYTQNSCSMLGYTTTTLSTGVDYGAMMGISNLDAYVYPHYSDDNMYWRAQSAWGDSRVSSAAKFFGWSRYGPNALDVDSYIDSSLIGSSGATSQALSNLNIHILNDDDTRGFTANLALAWIGGGLTFTEVGHVRSRMATFAAAF